MADARLIESVVLCAGLTACAGCAPPPASPRVATQSPPRDATAGREGAFDADGPMPRFRSKRFALSLGLPRGSEWRIDDHSTPALVATHAASHSRVLVAVFFTDANVGRDQCQAAAEERKLVPAGPFQTLDDETQITQQTFDTRIEVVIAAGSDPNEPVTGHVMAFGGYLRKCFVFDYSTEVPNAKGAELLSSRLAFAQTRILDGLEMDAMASPARERPLEQKSPSQGAPAGSAPMRTAP